jgi:V8-like Glu-specific endopeptidase
MPLEFDHREKLVQVLSAEALAAAGSTQDFFIALVKAAKLSKPFLKQAIALPKGHDSDADVRAILEWADNKGGNPQDSRFTVLGSVLTPLLSTLGLEDAGLVVAIVVKYQLYRDLKLLENLMVTYQVPLLASPPSVAFPSSMAPVLISPDFTWDDRAEDYTQLQGLLQQRRVTFLDVGFLQKAIQQAAAVCRIELLDRQDPTKRRAIGTGFLVTENRILTNYHVLAPEQGANMNAYVDRLEVSFGRFSISESERQPTQTFKLAAQPILKSSPTADLDYVLLQLEDRITLAENLQPARINPDYPTKDTGLNILQHPAGEVMKLALSPNGITRVLQDKGLLHYISDTAGGSSGSPCYDDDWRVIALHHAEKSGPAWVYREGVLMREIYREIEDWLG